MCDIYCIIDGVSVKKNYWKYSAKYSPLVKKRGLIACSSSFLCCSRETGMNSLWFPPTSMAIQPFSRCNTQCNAHKILYFVKIMVLKSRNCLASILLRLLIGRILIHYPSILFLYTFSIIYTATFKINQF